MARHHVILIPGFFAFGSLGELRYWTGVDRELREAFDGFGLEVDLTEIETLPTASIRYRAAKVVEAIAEVASRDDGPIHLVGHSTGGLDARVAVTPHAALATQVEFNAFERVSSIVTIATPHRGTPIASLFGSVMGQPLLRFMSSSAIVGLRRGKLPLSSLLRVGSLLVKLDDFVGFEHTVIDQLYAQLFSDFDDERRQALIRFLDQVANDRSLVVQLTPDSLDLFNATTADPDGIAYGSVITRARPPKLRGVMRYHDPYAYALHTLFGILWLLGSRSDERYRPVLSDAQQRALIEGYGALPELSDNDAMTPTLSQVWGEVVHVATADHWDVIGQYGASPGVLADWLPSGSDFDRARFSALWRDVAAFVTRSARSRA